MAAGSVDARDASANVSTASCQTAAFDTSQSRFRPGFDNQGTVWGNAHDPPNGYWEGAGAAAYAVGFEWEAPYELRNHFTFDLSSLPAGSATGAVLVLRNGNDWSYGPGGSPPAPRGRDTDTGTEPAPCSAEAGFQRPRHGSGVRRQTHHRVHCDGAGGPHPAQCHGRGGGERGGRRILLGRRPADQPQRRVFSILWRSTSSSLGRPAAGGHDQRLHLRRAPPTAQAGGAGTGGQCVIQGRPQRAGRASAD